MRLHSQRLSYLPTFAQEDATVGDVEDNRGYLAELGEVDDAGNHWCSQQSREKDGRLSAWQARRSSNAHVTPDATV